MNRLAQGIEVRDEVALYLTLHGLKPACWIALDSLYFDHGYPITQDQGSLLKHSTLSTKRIDSEQDILLHPKDVAAFEEVLAAYALPYKNDSTVLDEVTTHREHVHCENSSLKYEKRFYSIGCDAQSLKTLIEAKNDKERGLALGYPSKAVNAFMCGKKVSKKAYNDSLARAYQRGIKIPSKLAYIWYLPEEWDIEKAAFPQETDELSTRYQRFVRTNNSELALRIEKCFFSSIKEGIERGIEE